jgi:hypothetical protein
MTRAHGRQEGTRQRRLQEFMSLRRAEMSEGESLAEDYWATRTKEHRRSTARDMRTGSIAPAPQTLPTLRP